MIAGHKSQAGAVVPADWLHCNGMRTTTRLMTETCLCVDVEDLIVRVVCDVCHWLELAHACMQTHQKLTWLAIAGRCGYVTSRDQDVQSSANDKAQFAETKQTV